MWLAIALTAYVILAFVSILDKFILSNARTKPVIFVFYSAIFVLPVGLLLPFGVSMPATAVDWFISAVAGISFALGLWVMYIGILKSEISHIGPLIGATIPFFVLILSRVFLSEDLPAKKLAAVFILIAGSLVASSEKSEKHNGWHTGMLWGVIAGFIFAVSHVASKYAYDTYGFYSGFVWTRFWIGAAGVLLLISPAVRKGVFSGKEDKKTSSGSKKNIVLVAVNKILGVIGVVAVQYAIAIGSVTVVNALAGVQYVFLMIIVALMSKYWPRIFKEDYTRREIAMEIISILLIAAGLALLV